jgi:hypothetical protein
MLDPKVKENIFGSMPIEDQILNSIEFFYCKVIIKIAVKSKKKFTKQKEIKIGLEFKKKYLTNLSFGRSKRRFFS